MHTCCLTPSPKRRAANILKSQIISIIKVSLITSLKWHRRGAQRIPKLQARRQFGKAAQLTSKHTTGISLSQTAIRSTDMLLNQHFSMPLRRCSVPLNHHNVVACRSTSVPFNQRLALPAHSISATQFRHAAQPAYGLIFSRVLRDLTPCFV